MFHTVTQGIAGLFFLFIPLQSLAGSVYVALSGDDVTGNGSSTNPYATIVRAHGDISEVGGDILLQSGSYFMGSFSLPSRSGDSWVTVKPSEGRGSVSIFSYAGGERFARIEGSKTALRDLSIQVAQAKAISISGEAWDVVIDNCLIDMRYSDHIENHGVLVESSGSTSKRITVKGNTFLSPTLAALSVENNVDVLHFINNTVHLPMSTPALFLNPAYAFSGVIVANNVINYGAAEPAHPVLVMSGTGKGTKIDANCVATPFHSRAGVLSDRLHTNTISATNLPFKRFDAAGGQEGASERGPCVDIIAQEILGVLQR